MGMPSPRDLMKIESQRRGVDDHQTPQVRERPRRRPHWAVLLLGVLVVLALAAIAFFLADGAQAMHQMANSANATAQGIHDQTLALGGIARQLEGIRSAIAAVGASISHLVSLVSAFVHHG